MAAMQAKDLLKTLLAGSFGMIRERLDEVADHEWNQRAFPGTSKPGFILWHCARILDWTANSAFRGVPEVADSDRWRAAFPREACYGAGIPDFLADHVAGTTTSKDVAEYLDGVKASVMPWFENLSTDSLDGPVSIKANQAQRNGYLEPAIWAEVEDLDGITGWNFLLRPSVGHIRRHMGEYDLLVGALRSRASTLRA
jgi:hypothetical protein